MHFSIYSLCQHNEGIRVCTRTPKSCCGTNQTLKIFCLATAALGHQVFDRQTVVAHLSVDFVNGFLAALFAGLFCGREEGAGALEEVLVALVRQGLRWPVCLLRRRVLFSKWLHGLGHSNKVSGPWETPVCVPAQRCACGGPSRWAVWTGGGAPGRCGAYSTVTLLAKLRGLSTSVPLAKAVW